MMTEADMYKSKIDDAVNELISLLEKFCNPNTSGIIDFNREFRDRMEDELHNLRIFRRNLIEF